LVLLKLHVLDDGPRRSNSGSHSCFVREILSHPMIQEALQLHAFASQERYLLPRTPRERPINKFQLDLNPLPSNGERLPWLTEEEFVTAYRMTRFAFHRLLDMIKDHSVFQVAKRGKKQYPVHQQLLTLLHYLSSSGSGASGARTRNHFHISYGAKDIYVRRCITAIRSCMRATYYSWPDVDERRQLAQDFKKEFHLPNAILLVDGTTFQLMQRPKRQDAADYSGRKDGYTITNLFFSDAKRQIRYYVSGWAGSAHDSCMWTNCKLYQDCPSKYFSPNEYVIGDSAFANGPHMVTTYRARTGGIVEGGNKSFNDMLSSPRVISEHVNGILKGRWCWLNCIPNILNEDPNSMKRILEIIDVTVILHNFLIQENLNTDEELEKLIYNKDEIRPTEDDSELPPDDELNRAIAANDPSGKRREQLRAYLSEQGYI
jgi:hypothetical protein